MHARPRSNLLPRIAVGDASAVEACLDEFGPTIHALAKRYLVPVKGDVEGAVQDVFVELWKNAGRYDPARGSEGAFVMTMAHRRLIDRQRWYASRFSVSPGSIEAEPIGARNPSSAPESCPADLRDEARAAAEALDALPPDEQNVLRLSIYAGLPHERIAIVTGTPVGTVKTRIRRGLERLRESLRSRGPGAPSAHEAPRAATMRATGAGTPRPGVGGGS